MNTTVEIIFDIIMAAVEIIILLYFVRDFRCRRQFPCMYLLLFAVLLGSMLFLSGAAENFYIRYLLTDIIATAVLQCFFRERTARIFLYVTIYTLVAYVSLVLVESIFKTTALELPGTAYMYTQFTYTLLARFMEFLILFLFQHFLRKIGFRQKSPYGFRLIYIQILISAVYFILISISLYHTRNIASDYAGLIFGFSFFVLFSILLSVIYTEYYMKAYQKNTDYETALYVKQQQCEIYKNQIEDQLQIRSLYHDMKNHLLILEHSGPEEFREYLADLKEQVDQYQNIYHTGNPYLDILLRDKRKICEENQIALDIRANFLDVTVLEPVEICIVCGNLIDNAIEANLLTGSGSRRFVEFLAHRQKSNFVIRISNPCREKTLKTGNRIISSKTDKKSHGFGIENVRRVIAGKNGFYTAKTENGIYTVYIVLPLS